MLSFDYLIELDMKGAVITYGNGDSNLTVDGLIRIVLVTLEIVAVGSLLLIVPVEIVTGIPDRSQISSGITMLVSSPGLSADSISGKMLPHDTEVLVTA